MPTFIIFLLALLLAGCGSTDSVGAAAPAGLSGRVVSESGTGVANVQVVVEERITNLKAQVVTGADGSFTLNVPAGVYDLGLDSQDPQTATCFYGPVTVGRDFVLHSSGGRPAGLLFGRLFLRSQVPAANRQVRLRSALLHGGGTDMPAPVTLRTGPAGEFSVDLTSTPVSLDVEAYDQGDSLDEWIDIAKLGKACYAEFAIEESEVENRLRCDESDGPSVSRSAGEIRGRLETGFVASLADHIFGSVAQLENGLLTSDRKGTEEQQYTLAQLIASGKLDDFDILDFADRTYIRVAENGKWWYRWAVNIYARDQSFFKFTDQTGDYYTLSVFGLAPSIDGRWHKVSYNSGRPDLVKIHFANYIPIVGSILSIF